MDCPGRIKRYRYTCHNHEKGNNLTIDSDRTAGADFNSMASKVSSDGQFVSNLLGEDSIDWVRSAVR